MTRAARSKRPQQAPIWPEPAEHLAPLGAHHAAMTNGEALQAIVEALGGMPERGSLYRVKLHGEHPKARAFIGEYVGLANDYVTGWQYALQFVIVNPASAADAGIGTRESPLILWPIDCAYIAPVETGDLDTPLAFEHDEGTIRI